MKDLPPSTYWMGVQYKIPSIQGAAKPLIYARKIPSIDEELKLKIEGRWYEYKWVIWCPFCHKPAPHGWQVCWFSFECPFLSPSIISNFFAVKVWLSFEALYNFLKYHKMPLHFFSHYYAKTKKLLWKKWASREVHVYMVSKNKKNKASRLLLSKWMWSHMLGLQRIRSEMMIGLSDHTLRVILCLHIIIRTEWELGNLVKGQNQLDVPAVCLCTVYLSPACVQSCWASCSCQSVWSVFWVIGTGLCKS